MIEYALNAIPRHGVRRSVMSQLHTCPGPSATSTGAARGARVDPRRVGARGRPDWSGIEAAIRHHERREPSITPASQAWAKQWSTETPSAHPVVIDSTTRARSVSLIRDRYARSEGPTGSATRARGWDR
jgi:hypothetical protein